MSKPMIARVVFESPLPQLDRVFDYEVPTECLNEIAVGVRVKVAFGRSAKPIEAFVVELADTSSYAGQLNRVIEVVSPARVLTPEVFTLARSVANRQAATLGEVLKLAVPDRSVAVEQKWLAKLTPGSESTSAAALLKQNGRRQTALIRPTLQGPESWVEAFLERCREQIAQGSSSIVVLPDYRDINLLLGRLAKTELAPYVIDLSAQQVKSARYAAHLRALDEPLAILVGTRSVVYAPANNLGLIQIWDDGDESHVEPTSPNIHSREVALIRQQQSRCDLFIAGHSRSTEVQRLVEIGYLEDVTKPFVLPPIAISDSTARVDSLAWNQVRKSLADGQAVLIQVASRGDSVSAYCQQCGERARCISCNGPVWLDERKNPRCRWCNAMNHAFACRDCGSKTLRSGRAGATRTVSEFAKAFPGAGALESNGSNRIQEIKPGKTIVVATPGCEPHVDGGYGAVILLDAKELLNRDSLRASEEAVRVWSNAVAHLALNGKAVLVGVAGRLAQHFALWSQQQLAADELQTRRELAFPPAVRLASVQGPLELIEQVTAEISRDSGIELLGPLPVDGAKANFGDHRFLIRYPYSAGTELATELKIAAAKAQLGLKRVSERGRASRLVRVHMDETEVI